MSVLIRLNDDGDLVLSAKMLKQLGADSTIRLSRQGTDTYLIHPVSESERYWATTTPEERADNFLSWVEKVKTKGPILSDEALRRENMYD